MKTITVLLAEDHHIVREGFRSLLKNERDINVVADAGTGRQAVALAMALRPDVVVMDIGMPLLNGLEATRQIRKNVPETKVLILSAYDDAAYVEQTLRFGASGYLIKQSPSHFLPEAIREVNRGNRFFGPIIAKRLRARKLGAAGQVQGFKQKDNHLSPRELEVLQLIAEGMPNKQVAGEMGVSFKTIDKHRQHLMGKLNIHDIAGLTRYAIAEGIIESSVRVNIV